MLIPPRAHFNKGSPIILTCMLNSLIVPSRHVHDRRMIWRSLCFLKLTVFPVSTPHEIASSLQHESEVTGCVTTAFLWAFLNRRNGTYVLICTSVNTSFKSNLLVFNTSFALSSHSWIYIDSWWLTRSAWFLAKWTRSLHSRNWFCYQWITNHRLAGHCIVFWDTSKDRWFVSWKEFGMVKVYWQKFKRGFVIFILLSTIRSIKASFFHTIQNKKTVIFSSLEIYKSLHLSVSECHQVTRPINQYSRPLISGSFYRSIINRPPIDQWLVDSLINQ